MFDPGTYWMATPKMGLGESKNGTPYIYIEGDITHQANGSEHQPVVSPATRTVKLYVSDAAAPFTFDKLEKLGFNGDLKNPRLSDQNAEGIWVQCDHETYEEKQKERWNLPGGAMEHKTPTSDAIRKINAMYAARKGKATAPKSAPKTKPPEPVAATTEDD